MRTTIKWAAVFLIAACLLLAGVVLGIAGSDRAATCTHYLIPAGMD